MRRFGIVLVLSAIIAVSVGTYTQLIADTRVPIARAVESLSQAGAWVSSNVLPLGTARLPDLRGLLGRLQTTAQSPKGAGKSTATIQTDQSDYPPDTQVNVTGSGWLPRELVELTFTETATVPPGGFTDGPFIFFATSDDLGNIANGDFSTDQHDVGVTFLLTAKGVISGHTAQTTFTDSLPGLFQIDGDATGGGLTSHDWNQVYADSLSSASHLAGTGAIQFTADGANSATDTTFSNSPKDTQDISAWKWGLKAVSAPKTDLEHGFAAAYQDSTFGSNQYGSTHTLLFVGTDRYASGANSAISIWFLHNPIGVKASDGTFVNKVTGLAELHTVGDLLIQASLGSAASVAAFQWVGGANPLQAITLSTGQEIHAINSGPISVPWSFIDSSGSTSPLAQEFFEVGLDLNEVFKTTSANLPDFSSFIITTRTSTSQTATLSDFILGNVSSAPDVAVTKAADAATVNAGGQVGYTVTVSNAGVGNLTGITLNDPLPAGADDWAFAVGGNPSNAFQITGSVGSQILSFVSPQTLLFNAAPLVAHVVATSKTSALGKLSNTATVSAPGEGSNFLSNNTATAEVVVVPVAANDNYDTSLNGTLVVAAPGVRSNDGTPLADFTSVLVGNPTHGTLTVTLAGNGSFTYKPTAGYTGSDSFTYKDQDAFGKFSNVATVTINIGNAPPVANNDSYNVDEDSTLTVATIGNGVLANDTDADGNSLAVTALSPISPPSHGTLTLNADGTFTYTPAANYNGPDSFTYKATDGVASSAVAATVTITVNPLNDAPVAVNDSKAVSEDSGATNIDVLANDSDVDNVSPTAANAGLTITAKTNGANGTVSIAPGGLTLAYTPNANFTGTDTFTYQITDGTANSNTATVTMTVNAVNDAPVAVDDTTSTNEDTAKTLTQADLKGNDTDVDNTNAQLSVTAVSAPVNGTVVLNGNLTVTFTPTANFSGTAGFDYTLSDGALTDTGHVTVTVIAVNDAPVAVDDTTSTNEDTAKTLTQADLKGNDTDVDSTNAQLSVTAVSTPVNGTVVLNGDGTVTFTPAANFNGTAGFDYTLSDGSLTDTGHVTVTVIAVNDAPVAVDDTTSTNEDTARTLTQADLKGNDTDVDNTNAQLSVTAVSAPVNGTVVLNANGTVTFTPTANFSGTAGFDYTLSDGALTDTGHVTVTVIAVNDAPVAVDDATSTNEDTAKTLTQADLKGNDTDVDNTNAQLSVTAVSGAVNGTVVLNGNGTVTFTPAANFNGTAGFDYTLSDGALTDTGHVTVTVIAVNDAPTSIVVNNDTLDENDFYDLSGSFSDSDVADSHTVTVNWGDGAVNTVINLIPGVFTFAASHQYLDDDPTITGSDNYVVTVTVADNSGAPNNTGTGGATVTVNNAAPIVVMSTGAITLSPGDGFSRPGSFSDAGTLDAWTATVDYGDGNGAQSLSLTGKTFGLTSPAYTVAGDHVVTVSVTDDDGGIGTKSFLVHVSTPPVIASVESQVALKNSPLSPVFSFTGTQSTTYTTSINWGDPSGAGNVQNGTSNTDGDGNGTVSGSHAYQHKGTYTVFVTVTDSLTGVSTTIAFQMTVN